MSLWQITIPSFSIYSGAMEERRKNEQVHCPVCRALWPYPQSSPSSNLVLDSMPVSVPVEGAESTMRGSGPVGVILGDNKITLLESLKDVRNECECTFNRITQLSHDS